MKDIAAQKTGRLLLVSEQAIEEVRENADERNNGPKHHAVCPDCSATLSVEEKENGRFKLNFIKHSA